MIEIVEVIAVQDAVRVLEPDEIAITESIQVKPAGAADHSAVAAVAIVAPAPALAQDQGIKVHGNWVIEVRDPDGSVHSRHESENALTDFGRLALANLLARVVNASPASHGPPQSGEHTMQALTPVVEVANTVSHRGCRDVPMARRPTVA